MSGQTFAANHAPPATISSSPVPRLRQADIIPNPISAIPTTKSGSHVPHGRQPNAACSESNPPTKATPNSATPSAVVRASVEELPQRRTTHRPLLEEAGHRSPTHAFPVGQCIARRDQHYRRSRVVAGQALRHLEPIQTRQLHIEQDDIGHEPATLVERLPTIERRPNDLEATTFEQLTDRIVVRPMVIDDEHPPARHVPIVADPATRRHRG